MTMKVNEINRQGMAACPKHLQGATKAERFDPVGEVPAGALNAGANDGGK
jgi:hypothetical protein